MEEDLLVMPAPESVPVKKPNAIVTQSNDLINAYFDMTTVQLRAFLYAVAHIHKNDKVLSVVKIPIKDLHPSKGGKNYRETVKLASELEDVKIRIVSMVNNGTGKPKRNYESYTIFPTVKYTEDSKYIVTRINSDLTQFLLNLQGNYTQAELEKLLSLKTIQAYRVYMFIKMNMYKIDKEPDALKFDYKELRLMLGLDIIENGPAPKKIKPESDLFGPVPGKVEVLTTKVKVLKYAEFDNFKKRILNTAKEELKKKGLLDFDFIVNKDGGRSVKSITFKLAPSSVIEQSVKVIKQPAPLKYKPSQPLPQGVSKVVTHLSLDDLQSMSKMLDYDKLVQSYLDHGFTWNADHTLLSGYEREI